MEFLSFLITNKFSPQTKNLFILPHQGLGDQLAMYGYVLEMFKKYDRIVLVIKQNIKETLTQLHKNKIIFYVINDDQDISPNFGYPEKESLISLFKQFNFDYHFHYCHALEPLELLKTTIWTFVELFYREFGLDDKLRYNFYVERNHERENACYKRLVDSISGEKYAVVHDDKDRNFIMKQDFLPDLPIFYLGLGTHVQDNIKSNNVFDYIKILENAEEIHIFDSFLALMIDLMNIKCKGNIYFHTYLRDGDPRLYKSKFIYL
jgi:hypothetical protein